MNTNLFKSSKRKTIFTLITIFAVLALIVLNLLLSLYTGNNMVFADMTYTGLYGVTEGMRKECEMIFSRLDEGEKVKITFCTDPDYLMGSETTRHPYVLAKKLEGLFPDSLEVEVVNAILNPTAVAQYKTSSLTTISAASVIVSYEGRYRILPASRFWLKGDDSSTLFNGEQRLASLMRSVTVIDHPTAYFLTDHGESYYDESDPESEMSLELYEFYSLLLASGLKVKPLDLSAVDAVPEDCVLLIINDPRTDFLYDPDKLTSASYVSDIEKLDRYLVTRQSGVIINKSHDVSLPNLEAFLETWGFSFGDALVKDESSSLSDANDSYTSLITQYDKDENSYGYAIYGDFADLSSAPVTVIENTGSISCTYPTEMGNKVDENGSREAVRSYVSFLTSSDGAKLYSKNPDTGEYTDLAGDKGVYDLASLTVRTQLDPNTAEYSYSYLFCSATGDLLDNKYLALDSYANYDVIAALVDNISRIDESADHNLGGSSLNSSAIGGKKVLASTIFSSAKTIYSNIKDASGKLIIIKKVPGISTGEIGIIAALTFIPPTALIVYGIYVHIKRRYL